MKSRKHGLSIIEALLATIVLSIVVLGASNYRYAATLQERQAASLTQATRIANYLLQSWTGTQSDPNTFNPCCVGVTDPNIATASSGPAIPSGFTQLGASKYQITANAGANKFFATLCWKDSASFYNSYFGKTTRVRTFYVIVDYSRNGGSITNDSGTDASVQLTTLRQF